MARKKTIRAARRRVKKKPEKGIKGLLIRIKRALLRNNTLTVISIVATILVAAIPFAYTLLKDKKSIKVYIGDFEIKDDTHISLLYLYPTSEINSSDIKGILPLTYKNISNNVDNFYSDLTAKLREITVPSTPSKSNELNTILKKTIIRKFESPRFKKVEKLIGAERHTFYATEDKSVIRYNVSQFNSKNSLDVFEEFRIDLNRFADDEDMKPENTVVRDYFDLNINFSYKDLLKPYYSTLSLVIVDFNNLDGLINYIDEQGSFPYYSTIFDLEAGKYVSLNKCLVIVPSILYDEESENYKMDRDNMKIYEIEYNSKNYYYDRRLIINNGKKKKKMTFPDLDISKPNTMKTINYVNEKTFKIMKERNHDDF